MELVLQEQAAPQPMTRTERAEFTKRVRDDFETSGRWQTRRHAGRSQKHLTEARRRQGLYEQQVGIAIIPETPKQTSGEGHGRGGGQPRRDCDQGRRTTKWQQRR